MKQFDKGAKSLPLIGAKSKESKEDIKSKIMYFLDIQYQHIRPIGTQKRRGDILDDLLNVNPETTIYEKLKFLNRFLRDNYSDIEGFVSLPSFVIFEIKNNELRSINRTTRVEEFDDMLAIKKFIKQVKSDGIKFYMYHLKKDKKMYLRYSLYQQ